MTWEEFVALCIPTPATITVEPYQGGGAYGDVYGPAAPLTPCVVEETNRLVRVQTQDAAGAEQVSSTTVYAPLDATVPPGSRVTLPAGRTAKVLAASRIEAHGYDLPEHLDLALE